MNKEMTPQERIEAMKKNLGNNFVEEAKNILKDGKILKGQDALEHFNKELNELTFEMEQLYPLNYEEFKQEFPRTIQLIQKVNSTNVIDAVNKGLVLQGWTVEANVNKIIENIKNNVQDPAKAEEEIALREDVLSETKRMKESFEIEWCSDLFWKTWKIKEGESRFKQLVQSKGETQANKRIQTLKNIGGLEFLKILQEEVYPVE